MGKKHKGNTHEGSHHAENAGRRGRHDEDSHMDDRDSARNENPPRTTTSSWLTTPKFGSSTSGGGEIEPGPERD